MPGSVKSSIKRPQVNHSLTIIIHLIGFLSVLSIVLGLSLYQTVRYPINNAIPISDWLASSTWNSIAKSSIDPDICHPPNQLELPSDLSHLDSSHIISSKSNSNNLYIAYQENNTWTIAEYSPSINSLQSIISNILFSSETLSKSYQPIEDFLVYPECSNNTCSIIFYQISKKSKSSIPGVYNVSNPPIANLHNFFFDTSNQIVSYTVNPHPGSDRVILNWKGDILHQIDESPGTNRTLTFQYYFPDEDFLVYKDESSKLTNFFLANGIGLFRRQCPILK